MKKLLFTFSLIIFSVSLNAQSETEILQVLHAFEEAIVENNSETAANILHDDARILESGNIETKEEYLSHHFHSDGRFLSAMNRETESREVFTEGNTAWVTTVSHIHGTYNEREINLNSLELAVLKKSDGNWQIVALHWSSSGRQ